MTRIRKARPEATLTDETGQIRPRTFMEGVFWALRKQEKYEERWKIRRAFIDYTDLEIEARDVVWDGYGEEYAKLFVEGAMSVKDRVCVAKCDSILVRQEERCRREREVEQRRQLEQAKADASSAIDDVLVMGLRKLSQQGQ